MDPWWTVQQAGFPGGIGGAFGGLLGALGGLVVAIWYPEVWAGVQLWQS